MIEDNIFLGIGWGFPPTFDRFSKSVEMVTDQLDIEQSLTVLFTTSPGERTMEMGYGCDLSPLAFQRLDLNLKTFMVNNIKEAIKRCEPRIHLLEVNIVTDNDLKGTVKIDVSYVVKANDMPGNFVYIHMFE